MKLVKAKVPTTIEAVVIRADGTTVNLGKINDSRWWWRVFCKPFADARIRKANNGVSNIGN